MNSAVLFCKNKNGTMREASRKYNVPLTTLSRIVHEIVLIGCKPGVGPVLGELVEARLASYISDMADMGFGLSREDVMVLAFEIAENSGIDHPFKNGAAGRKWLDGFRKRHPNLSLHNPEKLSYYRAKAVNKTTIDDFFAKLGGIYACLNILTTYANL